MKNLAVIGTSHVNALRAAVDAVGGDPFFFALNAPILSKENSLGWQGEIGTMSCQTDLGNKFLNRIFSEADRVFDPVGFEYICLVDFFFCYDYIFILRNSGIDMVSVEGRLISHNLFKEVIAAQLGWSQYSSKSAVGEVPGNSVLPLLASIRSRAPDAKIFLTPRPLQLAGNRSVLNINISLEEIILGRNLFDAAAIDLLSPLGITYISQPEKTFDKVTGLTANCYSVGPHATLSDRLDEHLNVDYGKHVLAQIPYLNRNAT
jgi:hypothetical protein